MINLDYYITFPWFLLILSFVLLVIFYIIYLVTRGSKIIQISIKWAVAISSISTIISSIPCVAGHCTEDYLKFFLVIFLGIGLLSFLVFYFTLTLMKSKK